MTTFCLFLILQALIPIQVVQVTPIPDAILAEGLPPATTGNLVQLHLVPRDGMDARLVEIRLVGIGVPEASGNVTTQLAQDSTLVLNGLIEWQYVQVECLRSESVTDWNIAARRYLDRSRLICSLKLLQPTEGGAFVPAKNADVSLEMLRRGRAWLRELTWQDEIADGDELAYYTAQSDARLYGRGLWLWAGASWPFSARPERLPASRDLPTRRQ
jgi:endonuclease YncB( thermonuclease family)